MLITTLTKGPDKVFVVIKNGSGSALTAGQVLEWKTASSVYDGYTVTDPTATGSSLIVGNADAATPSGEYGLAQVYGYDDDALMYKHGTATNSNVVIGDQAIVISAISGWSAAVAGAASILHPYMAACAVSVASSSASTGVTNAKVFLRCM
ncbi:MAG: hypothetical protein ACYS8I_11100 [Planctomycetota bacterium]|jgi:hypothetical protein